MAAKKKRKPKAKQAKKKSAPAKKPVAGKKHVKKKVGKKAPSRPKMPPRRPSATAPGVALPPPSLESWRAPLASFPSAKARAAKPARPPVAAAPAVPAAPPGEQRVGIVTHYFGHLAVAVVQVEEGALRVGDTIHIKGHTSDFRQRVDSLQIEHASVPEARAGQSIGLRVTEHAREHDVVYKVTTP